MTTLTVDNIHALRSPGQPVTNDGILEVGDTLGS